ncbi:MAG: sugar phosphate isomerase/epimerase [Candidatus Cloacimonetes bacterium]|nr:sugar phosphate isomerase/epimerase [Candidatus Cloacimonadota bacterium]
MRVSFSNIAWDVDEDYLIADMLRNYGVKAIDIAPGKYFPVPSKASSKDIASVKAIWLNYGIEIVGMQALLFGNQGFNIFGDDKTQLAMLNHLDAVCRIANRLGLNRLVFGSPKNRDCSGLSDEATIDIAKNFFTKLGDIALKYKVIFCLEPNPVAYGANFMTNGNDTYKIVKAINHPSIKMQLDTGAILMNKESIYEIISLAYSEIGHIHISEPLLEVVGNSGKLVHKEFATAIKQKFSNPLITIEMKATKNEPHHSSIERALIFVNEIYKS